MIETNNPNNSISNGYNSDAILPHCGLLKCMTTNGAIQAGLVVLIGIIIGVSVQGCKESKDYYDRGVARLDKGDHDGAISDFTKVIKKNPGYAMAYFYRGRAYFGKRENDQALTDLDKAIELDPKLAVAYGERAMIYFIKKEYDKTWENIRKQESLGLEVRDGFLKALQKASGRSK